MGEFGSGWIFVCIFFIDTSTSKIYPYCTTLSLHYALPISAFTAVVLPAPVPPAVNRMARSRPSGVGWASLDSYRVFTVSLAASCTSALRVRLRSEEHTSELQSLMRISYAVFCLEKKIKDN